MKTAVVVGGLGIVGRYIIDRLASLPDWRVVGLSRRLGENRDHVRYVSVDLLDPRQTEAALAELTDTTHVFYAAFQPGTGGGPAADYAKNIAANRDMLVNAVSALDRVAVGLERVVLITGSKYYGSHLGPYKTPSNEDDPRHPGQNYYFDQIDWLTAFQKGRRWTWSELRPHAICGFSPGTAMSLVSVIAVYAAIQKALGRPLSFPGTAWTSLYQVTEAAHLAKGAEWAATDPRCANRAHNLINGDYFRWKNIWPAIASVFDMPTADPEPVSLVESMSDKARLWARLTAGHGLQPIPFDHLVAWPFGDYVFACNWDIMSSMTRTRFDGFQDVVDSEEMFVRLLRRFRAERIVP